MMSPSAHRVGGFSDGSFDDQAETARGNFSTLTSEAFHPDPPKKTDLLQKSRGAPGQPLQSAPERWPAHRRARVVQWPPADGRRLPPSTSNGDGARAQLVLQFVARF